MDLRADAAEGRTGWTADDWAERKSDLSAKAELIKYLGSYDETIYGEWGGQFPAGFLGSEVKGSIEWENLTDDIEAFAQMVVFIMLLLCFFLDGRIQQRARFGNMRHQGELV